MTKSNFIKIQGGLYIVRTQAGFKHALRDFGADTEYTEGFPQSHPALIALSDEYRGYIFTTVRSVHLNVLQKAIGESEQSAISTIEVGDNTTDNKLIEAVSVTNLLVHPGETLSSEIKARGLTEGQLALKLMVPQNRITEIVRCKKSISPDTALRLARYFGTSAQFWMNLQTQHDLAKEEALRGDQINNEITPAQEE